MKHLTTSEYVERVRTLGYEVDLTLSEDQIIVGKDKQVILSVTVNKPYRMDSNWEGLSRHLSNNSLVREMLVEALLVISVRYANTPIPDRNLTHETSVSSTINIDQLREYQAQIQTIIENETEVDY